MWNKHLGAVVVTALVSLGIFWLPYKLQKTNWLGIDFGGTGMERVVQNFDGINFLIVAKTWYNPKLIENNYQDVLSGRRPLYFSAHYPGYPAVIAGFNRVLNGPNALLSAIALSNVLLAIGVYYFAWVFTKNRVVAMWIGIASLFFPARMLADRSVGSNEPLFIFFSLLSLSYNQEKKPWLSAVMGSLAVLTRSPGILLFAAYGLQILLSEGKMAEKAKRLLPYLLIPLSLLGLWFAYGYRFGSFWAYFQVGGNLNIYLPFSVFTSHQDWISGIWNEDIIYLFMIIATGITIFWKKYRGSGAAWYGLIYAIFVMCVAHRDLSRYSLPIMPLISVAGSELLGNKIVRLIGLLLLVPIFMYSWQFVIGNYQPIMDWARYL